MFDGVLLTITTTVIIPKAGLAGKDTIGAVKDTVNDGVKNSATLAKDVFKRANTIKP